MKIMLSKKHITAIAKAIAAGCPMETAALQAGICRRTLYQWRKTGKQASRGIFFELNAAIEMADATFIKRSLALISAHGRHNAVRALNVARRHLGKVDIHGTESSHIRSRRRTVGAIILLAQSGNCGTVSSIYLHRWNLAHRFGCLSTSSYLCSLGTLVCR